jgi:hypothetical protein
MEHDIITREYYEVTEEPNGSIKYIPKDGLCTVCLYDYEDRLMEIYGPFENFEKAKEFVRDMTNLQDENEESTEEWDLVISRLIKPEHAIQSTKKG